MYIEMLTIIYMYVVKFTIGLEKLAGMTYGRGYNVYGMRCGSVSRHCRGSDWLVP